MKFWTGKKPRKPVGNMLAKKRTFPFGFGQQWTTRQQMNRAILCGITILALLLITESWRSPFPHRIGDQFPHGLSARTTFEIVNTFETNRVRNEQEKQVPFYFRNDAAYLRTLPRALQADLGTISESDSLEDLPRNLRRDFGLQPNYGELGDTSTQQQVRNIYSQLKSSISPGDVTRTETIISSIVEEMKQLLEPIMVSGIISQEEVNRLEIGDSVIAVIPADNELAGGLTEPKPIEVHLVDVRAADLLNDAGLIGRNLQNYPALDPIKTPLMMWLRTHLLPSLRYDQAMTQEARSRVRMNVQEVRDKILVGDTLLPPNGVIEKDNLLLNKLQAEYRALINQSSWMETILRITMIASLLVVLLLINGFYVAQYEPRLVGSLPALSTYLAAIVLTVLFSRWFSYDPWQAEVIPVMVTVMIFSVAYSQALACLTALSLCLIVTLSTQLDLTQFVVLLSTSTVSTVLMYRMQSRSIIIWAGILAGIVYIFVNIGMHVVASQDISAVLQDPYKLINSLRGGGWCVVAGYFVAGSLPFIESIFGVVTGISLLELSEPSHPLLQELVRRAPGTYNHSITVASIAEAAAESIGANGLLTRIGAYFHDVGKIPKAEYFVENRRSGMPNKHDSLAPAMSTLIIIGHVKEGVNIAEQYGLPQALIDFIEQHHGTTLVEYFYHAAREKAEMDDNRSGMVEESSFRYPGPKPQSKETGILMLSDAVESASRTLSEPTPARIERLVHDITMKRLLDGQFDESTLTLTELQHIEDSLIKSLTGIYHGRIAYPDAKSEPKIERSEGKSETKIILPAMAEARNAS
jgi:putative nucleotidyltransferase with HDIG domain